MLKSIQEKLSKPFDEKFIKERAGSFGKALKYIEGHVVIGRLNDVFGSSWSFEVTTNIQDTILDGHIVIKGRLIVPNVVKINDDGSFEVDKFMPQIIKEQVGGKKVTIAKRDNSKLDLAADEKASITDCLKKCATLLGVGLELYGVDESDDEEDSKEASVPAVEAKEMGAAPQQINAIKKMAEAKKVDLPSYMKNLKMEGTPETLTQSEAKKLIAELNAYVAK